MSGIGAELPPHLLAKRKRQQEEEAEDAPATAAGAKRSASPKEPEKRRKVMGPAMPPASLEKRPSEPPTPTEEDSSDDDDDDFGPALPTGGAVPQTLNEDEEDDTQASDPSRIHAEERLKRDDWMMMPPKQDDLAARMDPTKRRPHGFLTGKGAKEPNALEDDSSTWHETPEQKQKRLRNEMMGIGKSAGPVRHESTKSKPKDDTSHRKIQEHAEKTRGPSLLEQHRQSKGVDAEDDPSKRAFDREKDMASGSRISTAQKREMLKQASGLSSKFSGGSYL